MPLTNNELKHYCRKKNMTLFKLNFGGEMLKKKEETKKNKKSIQRYINK